MSHRILGAAMSVLHDHPLLGADEILASAAGNDLGDQFERIRITPLPLSARRDVQAVGRLPDAVPLSAAYEVTVVLIDSRAPPQAALPVLTRARTTVARSRSTVARFAGHCARWSAARPGGRPAGRGGGVDGDTLTSRPRPSASPACSRSRCPSVELARRPAQAEDPRGSGGVRLPPSPRTPMHWVAGRPGSITVDAGADSPGLPPVGEQRRSVALAPRSQWPERCPTEPPPGSGADPHLLTADAPGQRVRLLFADRQLEPTGVTNPDPTSPTFQQTPTTLTFDVPDVPPGTYTVRLRVDGVDSIRSSSPATPPSPRSTLPSR